MNWDLTSLYSDESELEADVQKVEQKAKNFEKICKARLKLLSEGDFLEALREYECILQTLGKVMTYAFLKFAKSSENGAFFAKYQKAYTQISEYLIFFELEFNRLSKTKQKEFIDAASGYRFYLESLQKQKPYQLSAKEERVLLKKSTSSGSAFSRLFDEHFSRMKFRYEKEELSEEKILSLLHKPDQAVRKKAANAFSKRLQPEQPLLAYIFNMIKKDHESECSLRGYVHAETPRHIENQITQKSVDALVDATEKSFDLVRDYYKQKGKLLGLKQLYDYDRYAPLEDKEQIYSYNQCKDIILKAFEKFSPTFANLAKRAFDEGWIDAFPADKKRGGAFSHPATPDAHPYVLLNHTDQRRDLFTLAHELGHALHQCLSAKVGYIGSNTPLTTSETASVFAEMLVFDYIKESLSDEEKLSLYASRIEDIFATLYRQINFTTFERKVHAHDGELSVEEFNRYWMQESSKMFGESIKLTKQYEMWWSYIPHFIHSPFYCYAYAYGQLLVLALYGLYKQGKKEDFLDNYILFLSSGGSKSPKELVAKFGFDIEDEAFWSIGIEEVKRLLGEFYELAKKKEG